MNDQTYSCRWPGCERQIPSHRWGCKFHWLKLPGRARLQMSQAYLACRKYPDDDVFRRGLASAYQQARMWIDYQLDMETKK